MSGSALNPVAQPLKSLVCPRVPSTASEVVGVPAMQAAYYGAITAWSHLMSRLVSACQFNSLFVDTFTVAQLGWVGADNRSVVMALGAVRGVLPTLGWCLILMLAVCSTNSLYALFPC